MATFVLVHGAYVGGWCWRWLIPFLRAAGHDVYAPTLTGLGERVHLGGPQVDLETHVTDIVNVLRYEDLTRVVLVGWSYGGTVVTGVTDRVPERIAHLVYLDSDVPRDGETSGFPPSRNMWRVERARSHGAGWRVPLTSAQEEAFVADLSMEQRRWVAARLVSHPLKTWTQPIRLSGAGAMVPTTYIRCTVGYDPGDEDMQRQGARIRGEPSWQYRELDASHFAPWTAPRAVANLLLGFV